MNQYSMVKKKKSTNNKKSIEQKSYKTLGECYSSRYYDHSIEDGTYNN